MRPTPPLLALLLALPLATSAQEPQPAGPPDGVEQPPEPRPAANEPKPDSIHFLGSRFSIVAGAGMLWPTSRATREAFGTNHLSPSIAFWTFRSSQGFGLSVDLAWRAFGENDGEANIWGLFPGVVWLGRHRTRDLIPYAALRAGPAFVKVPDRDVRLAFGGTLDAGVVLWQRLIVSGRYDRVTREAGFDLSSLSARIAVRVF
jgi:hypothetical protein